MHILNVPRADIHGAKHQVEHDAFVDFGGLAQPGTHACRHRIQRPEEHDPVGLLGRRKGRQRFRRFQRFRPGA